MTCNTISLQSTQMFIISVLLLILVLSADKLVTELAEATTVPAYSSSWSSRFRKVSRDDVMWLFCRLNGPGELGAEELNELVEAVLKMGKIAKIGLGKKISSP